MEERDRLKAPFTDEQVSALNRYQEETFMHPFTCCSHNGCERHEREDDGVLIATNEGWVCPCGVWKQDWAHEFMLDEPIDPFAHVRAQVLKEEEESVVKVVCWPADFFSPVGLTDCVRKAVNMHKLAYFMWRLRNVRHRSPTFGKQMRSRNRWLK